MSSTPLDVTADKLGLVSGNDIPGGSGNSITGSPKKPPERKISSTTAGAAMKKSPKDFVFGKIIGEGSFSTVYVAKEVSTEREWAIKVCEKRLIKKERKVNYVTRERDVMKMLIGRPHKFFVSLYCTFQDEERLYFVMSWAKNGELLDYLKKLGSFDDEVTRFYAAELVLALEHLHMLGVIHRDMKPENILLSEDMHLKLSDFGSAKITAAGYSTDRPTPLLPVNSGQRKMSFVGTAQYVSPEILNGQICTPSCDLWALGCIIYQMLSGLPPFRAANEYLIFQKILKLDYTFPNGFNPLAKDLVQSLLVIEAEGRLGNDEADYKSLKAHKFFENLQVDWGEIPSSVPPDVLPYLPATPDNNEPLRSNYKVPSNLKPGLDDKQLTRLLGLDYDACSNASEESLHILNISPSERERRLEQQAKHDVYHKFVEGNLILKSGSVDKRKGLFARTRHFLLTEGPHLYYVDPANMELKGEVPWCKEMRPEAKNFKTFFVHTPNRTYYLIDHTGHAPDWCEAIEQVRQHYFCSE